MSKRFPLRIIDGFFIVVIACIIYMIYPRNYDGVGRYEPLENTAYWDFPNESNIGYQFIPASKQNNKTPIIYLHGGPGGAISNEIVESLQPFAEEGHPVYAYDQIGSGSSDRLSRIESYTVARHVDDLKWVTDEIGVEKVILLGQSWGSILATFFTLDYPEKVEKIIMTGPGPIFPLDSKLADFLPPDSLDIKEPAFSNKDGIREVYTLREKIVRWFANVHGKKIISDRKADQFFTHLNNALNRSTVYDQSKVTKSKPGGGYFVHLRTMKDLYHIKDRRVEMSKLSTPIFILKGQYDNQKWGYTQEYLQLFPNAKMEIVPKAGHFIQVEQPDIYYSSIKKFLSEQSTVE